MVFLFYFCLLNFLVWFPTYFWLLDYKTAGQLGCVSVRLRALCLIMWVYRLKFWLWHVSLLLMRLIGAYHCFKNFVWHVSCSLFIGNELNFRKHQIFHQPRWNKSKIRKPLCHLFIINIYSKHEAETGECNIVLTLRKLLSLCQHFQESRETEPSSFSRILWPAVSLPWH